MTLCVPPAHTGAPTRSVITFRSAINTPNGNCFDQQRDGIAVPLKKISLSDLGLTFPLAAPLGISPRGDLLAE